MLRIVDTRDTQVILDIQAIPGIQDLLAIAHYPAWRKTLKVLKVLRLAIS
jgi:hypothetical protein